MFLSLIELKKSVPLLEYIILKNEIIIVISSKNLVFCLKILKFHVGFQYKLLTCISGIDFLGKKYRFCVAYELLSLTYNNRLRVKIFINEITFIPSCVSIYVNANWWEREIWDLFGLYFDKHPDLRRLLTDYGFEGYPLRKDFPLSGYVEVRYSEIKKRIVVDFLELTQEFRLFNFENPW